ncbi:uncharacterized protein LOC124276752 [Haliotis rubra]|uniref:uncharacterized protein LOC124276752 n=1 Tax=Haliotis rubra TaxID=36100 RepID=UPI001EE596EC|nr:uncharacterized protein LOC124276752 [Haliotis rubra]
MRYRIQGEWYQYRTPNRLCGVPSGSPGVQLHLLQKGHAARRQITAADLEQAPSDDYQFYCEIEEANMGVSPQIQPVSHSHLEEELNLDMLVIADVFPAAPAIVHRDGDTSPASPASSTSQSYTHLIP